VRIDNHGKLRRYFEPVLAAAMDKDQETAAKHHEVGELDGDPFIDAQDFEIKHFDVAIKDTAPGKVTVTVRFDNFGEQHTIVLDLIAIKNDWRIYDITWPRDEPPKTLRALFRLTRQGYQHPHRTNEETRSHFAAAKPHLTMPSSDDGINCRPD